MSRKLIVSLAALLILLALPCFASAQAGWTTKVAGKTVVMTPPDLAAGEFFQITIYPRTSMGGALITDYVDGAANRELPTLGTLTLAPKPAQASDHTVAVTDRRFRTPQGAVRVVVYMAIAADGENARIVRVQSDQSLFARYEPQAAAVMKEMRWQEDAAAKKGGRGVKTEELPPTPKGMTLGGKIMPGIYAGNCMDTYDGKIVNGIRLYLYASGECRLCNETGEDYRSGPDAYSYDAVTGKLDVAYGQQYDLYNSVLGPDDAWCLYGHGSDGTPYLQADSDHGTGRMKTLLRYVGPPDRPSPKQLAAQKAAAEAEAKRYKYVTAPGRGVQAAQIAGILYSQTYILGQGDAKNEIYLLLKDGTIHDGLPVPPDELDVSLSRRREPEHWGRWRRQGIQYTVAWPDQPNHFEPLKGKAALPAKAGEQLAGRFGTGSTTGSMIMGGSYHLWGVTFTPGARFLKDSSGGASSGSLGQTMNDFSVSTTYDDSGSTTSFSSPAAVGYAGRKKPAGHRGGTYSLSGYTLTLRYDDGRVERVPFFFTDAKHDEIYLEGATLAFDKDK